MGFRGAGLQAQDVAEAELLRELAAVEAEFNGHDESADALAMDDLDGCSRG